MKKEENVMSRYLDLRDPETLHAVFATQSFKASAGGIPAKISIMAD